MMRRVLFAAGVALSLPAAARAQDAVETGEVGRQAVIVAKWVKELSDWETSLFQQLEQLEAMTGFTEVMQMASQLNTLTYQVHRLCADRCRCSNRNRNANFLSFSEH